MLKTFVFACLFLVISQAGNTNKSTSEQTKTPIRKEFLYGVWWLDSVSNGARNSESLCITRDDQFHIFSHSTGNELVFYGCYKNQKLFNQYDMEYPVISLDSDQLVIRDEYNQTTCYYQKSIHKNVEKELAESMDNHRLRGQLLGWWKFNGPSKNTEPDPYIKPEFYHKPFAWYIREDGRAEVFENFNTANPLLFNYLVTDKTLNIREGCLVTFVQILTVSENKLTVAVPHDTISLERITRFN